jgi:hypothetical protein
MLRAVIFGGALLIAAYAEAGAQSFIGRWSIDPAGCTSEGDTSATAPLIATATSIKWLAACCKFARLYKVGRAVHIQAHCGNEGRVVSTPITLEARGDRLRVTWDGVKVQDMRRCK